MNRKTKAVIFIYLLVFALLAAVIYIIPSITGKLTPTTLLTYGNLTETDRETCYFIRDERVYLAGMTGDVNYYFEDNTKVRRNTTILAVSGQHAEKPEKSEFARVITQLGSSAVTDTSYRSEFNGVVSYYVDGFEGYFTPDSIGTLDFEEVRDLPIDQPVNLTRKLAFRGEPLYKLCRNDKWYITCWVTDGNSVKYQKGNKVTFRLPAGELPATVTEIAEKNGCWQVIFESDRYYEDFATIRVAEVDIVTSDYSGIIVPNRSIASVDGQVGVYVKQTTGEYRFTPVKIKASDGEESAVASSYYYDEEGKRVDSVEIYDEILKNPE